MKGKNILIVDDSDFDRTLLGKGLSMKADFALFVVKDGHQCLKILDTEKIDLILMDIIMPGYSGIEILVKIRERFNPIELPVIMVTAKSDPIDVIHCLNNGANDYISKPINFDVAMSRIATHLMLADLSFKMSKLNEMKALDALIATYNHEINNPLSIALGYISMDLVHDMGMVEKLETSLWRIAEVTKKISAISEQKEAYYEKYTHGTSMIKLK